MADAPYRDTSNIGRLCCISRDNVILKNTIEQQSNTIGVLLQQKRDLQEQYENLLMSIDMLSINLTSNVVDVVDNSSNIIQNVVENSSNVVENTSNVVVE